ncbi:tRNA dihydrouridine synthase DusB [Candidatus Uhrbacteria bacterium]|jgi:tRNA-dihydrouridine synthase B|nr:tRNA dihydrouridine synthase DusB [Candidatus Uhrbacteria bacterium]MBT7717118.1 tRNA dihydrouridine synthase DusB [Candidatus Uhrbacteria bacterium]
MPFSWKNQKSPIVALSPMADMTDAPFGKIIREVVLRYVSESRLVIFREMISSEAVTRGNEKTLAMAKIPDSERPVVQQIFGAKPEVMAKAAKLVADKFHPEAIDINMGCPVYKMTSSFNGAALMKDAELATKIVREVKAVVDIPVSVKMRAGWSDHKECIEFAKLIEEAGADLITVHGRTKAQAYSGLANREVVARVKESVSIPVLYNGDIFTWEDYFKALDETGCDGALIGRGALGNPWIFAQIEQQLAGAAPMEVTLRDRIDTALTHLDYHLAHYGEKSLPTFRKHLAWYFKGVEGFKPYKPTAMTATDKEVIAQTLEEFYVNSTK